MVSTSYLISQGYMAVSGATVRIRLRREVERGQKLSPSALQSHGSFLSPSTEEGKGEDGTAYLTIKGKSHDGGLSRYEFERQIPIPDALEMLQLCEGGRIDKVRHIVNYEGHVWEIDEFYGDNEGLLMAEVELKEPDEPVVLPHFIGPEVTGNPFFYNKNMLAEPYPIWQHTLPKEYQ
jgi:CYTH domain-containing protein